MSQIVPSVVQSEPAVRGGAPIALDVRFELEPTGLKVRYRVKNTREHPIYLFNLIWEFGPKGQYVPARMPVYACLRQTGLLHLAKTILPPPRNHSVELRIVPFASKIEAGHTFEEELQLPLPVDEFNSYFPVRRDSKYKVEPAHTVLFSLDFVNEAPDMKAATAPLPNGLRLQHPKLLALVETVQSEPQPLRVPVNKRQDEFEEF